MEDGFSSYLIHLKNTLSSPEVVALNPEMVPALNSFKTIPYPLLSLYNHLLLSKTA